MIPEILIPSGPPLYTERALLVLDVAKHVLPHGRFQNHNDALDAAEALVAEWERRSKP